MKRLLLSLALANLLPYTAFAGETPVAPNISFDQLLSHLTAAPAETAVIPEPSAERAAYSPEEAGRYWVTVEAADKRARTRLLEAGLDIVEINKDSVSGVAGAYTLGRRQFGHGVGAGDAGAARVLGHQGFPRGRRRLPQFQGDHRSPQGDGRQKS